MKLITQKTNQQPQDINLTLTPSPFTVPQRRTPCPSFTKPLDFPSIFLQTNFFPYNWQLHKPTIMGFRSQKRPCPTDDDEDLFVPTSPAMRPQKKLKGKPIKTMTKSTVQTKTDTAEPFSRGLSGKEAKPNAHKDNTQLHRDIGNR